MRDTTVDRFIIEAGISPTLEALFQSIAEQDFDGHLRFRDRDCRELAKVIACRIYAKPLLELCHMVRAAGLLDRRRRYETLFWAVIPATPANFRDYLNALAATAPDGLSISPGELGLHYADGEAFAIKYGRMPFLAAFMDFLVNALGFEECDDVFAALTGEGVDQRFISDAAKELAKRVYRYLEGHLPSVQAQKKFRQITAYLEARFGPAFSMRAIDDPCILDFWLEMSALPGEDSGNFTGFPTAFDAFIRFVQAVDLGRQSREAGYTVAIGSDREAGEVDPDSLQQLADLALNEEMAVLERLGEPPMDAVKFLNKRETDMLAYLLPRFPQVERWLRSYLRSEVFGKGQARLSQALRNKTTAEKFLALIDEAATETYEGRVGAVEKLGGYLAKLLLACIYVLRRDKAEDVGVIDFATMGKARKAFHSISRQGFQEETLDRPEIREAFDLAADCLTPINDRVVQLLDMLNALDDLQAAFDADRPVFSKQFMTIYGEPV